MGMKFSEWAEEQKANETPAQAELRRRFAAAYKTAVDAQAAALPAASGCGCDCHLVCSCDLTLSVRTWRCERHEDAHCQECQET